MFCCLGMVLNYEDTFQIGYLKDYLTRNICLVKHIDIGFNVFSSSENSIWKPNIFGSKWSDRLCCAVMGFFQDRETGKKYLGRPWRSWHCGVVCAEGRFSVLCWPGRLHQSPVPKLQQDPSHEGGLHTSQELPGEHTWSLVFLMLLFHFRVHSIYKAIFLNVLYAKTATKLLGS